MLKKRNLIFLSLIILGILLLTGCFLNPPATEGILKGQIMVPEGTLQTKDLTGQALPDATVNIMDLTTGAIIATTVTDANGYYQVSVPPGGPYLLEAVKDGVKLEQITCPVEVGVEYDLGTADCTTTSAALIAQAMMDAGENLADIDCAAIMEDPNFDDVLSIVCSTIQAGEDPTASAAIEQAVEDFLYPPAPTPTPNPTPPPAVINIAAIPGVTAPVAGATGVTTITETAQYTGTVTWVPAEDPFLGSQVYAATITLIPKAGFTLTGVAENFFTVAGTSSPATNAVNSGVVTAEFLETAAVVIDIEVIAGVTIPVKCETPVTMITATAQYTGAVTWSGTPVAFAGAIVYTAIITLTPKPGFTLTGVAANFFTVAGAVATNPIDSGVVTAVFPETDPLAVGDSYGGGKVAYILQTGESNGVYSYDANVQHGLIAATEDQSTGIQWYNGTNLVTGATGTALGTGFANTYKIIAVQGPTITDYAAGLAIAYRGGGYIDWFLPSQYELDKLFNNKDAIGGFVANPYWSSSEYSALYAWNQNFYDGSGFYSVKDYTDRVRAVRAF